MSSGTVQTSTVLVKGFGDVEFRATFSDDFGPGHLYRYSLERIWDPMRWGILWIMLNPSVASHLINDPTIRRCMGFAKDLGAGRIAVVNMFAYIATSPKELVRAQDPVGPDNWDHVLREMKAAQRVVAGWGVLKHPLPKQIMQQIEVIRKSCPEIQCLGWTKDGHPGHPLYVPGTRRLVPWLV